MACAFVDTGHGLTFTSPGNFSMTITAGTRAIVQIMQNVQGGTLACDIGGTPGVLVTGSDTTTTYTLRSASFVVDSPPSGSQTVNYSSTGSPAELYCSVTTASGSATVANGAFTGANINGLNHVDLAMTSASGDLSVTACYCNGAGAPTPSETQDWTLGTASADHKAPNTDVNPTHVWTKNINENYTVTGANFAQTAPSTTSPMFRGT